MRIFHVQLLFEAATESCSIDCAANNNILTILTPYNSYGECKFEQK